MAHEEKGSGLFESSNETHAALAKDCIAHAKCFVDNQHRSINVGNHCEGKSHKHPARVRSDGLMDELSDICEGLDVLESLLCLLP